MTLISPTETAGRSHPEACVRGEPVTVAQRSPDKRVVIVRKRSKKRRKPPHRPIEETLERAVSPASHANRSYVRSLRATRRQVLLARLKPRWLLEEEGY